MQVNLWSVLVVLLVLAIPSIGYGNAQSNGTLNNGTRINQTQMNETQSYDNLTETTITDNVTDLVGNITKHASSPFINSNETSAINNSVNIVINEVELNPQGSDSDHEWVELYNPTGFNASVGGLEIITSFKSATIPLPSNAEIKANGTYVVELGGQVLSNTAESLVLANISGTIIDRTPSFVDRSDDDRTWQRIPDGNDVWQFAPGTRDALNDPGQQAGTTRDASASSAAQCQGMAGCAEGMVTRIVDGDTLYIRVNNTTYKIDLALTKAPSSNEQGFIESTSFTRNLCLGSNALVDQDDKLLTSTTSIIAVVYCDSANLNSALLDNGFATLDSSQCETSEFGSQSWAKEHGC